MPVVLWVLLLLPLQFASSQDVVMALRAVASLASSAAMSLARPFGTPPPLMSLTTVHRKGHFGGESLSQMEQEVGLGSS